MLVLASMLSVAAAFLPLTEILAPGPDGDLKGSLSRAEDPAAPVVLMIPGSGPTDRDGNSPLGVNAGTYRLLAESLGAGGISTVRIDKRGTFGSVGAVIDANAVTIDDYVDDTRSWINSIRNTTNASCVWILGHSEGGLVALAAAQAEDSICGLILLAAPGRPLGDVLKEQLHANPANRPFLAAADAAIDALVDGRRVDDADLPDPIKPLFANALQGFLISVFSLNPAELAGRVSVPILVVQGEEDIQVSMRDAEALAAATPLAHLLRLPGTNHVFKAVSPKDAAANIKTYADPSLPLAPGVAKAIRKFIFTSGEKR